MTGKCKACGAENKFLNKDGLCYAVCASYQDDDTARCPKCGRVFKYEVDDFEGESEHDVSCPMCDYGFALGIEIDYSFMLYSPDRILEDK